MGWWLPAAGGELGLSWRAGRVRAPGTRSMTRSRRPGGRRGGRTASSRRTWWPVSW